MGVNGNIFFDDTDPVNAEVVLDGPNIPNVLVGELTKGSDAVFLQHWNRIYKLIIHDDEKLELKS